MIIKNTSNANIVDYNVDKALYTILAGQTVDIPDTAAEYLMKVYHFLQKSIEEVKQEPKIEQVEPTKTEEVEVTVTDIIKPLPNNGFNKEELEAMEYKKLQEIYKAKTGKGKMLKKEEYIEQILSA